jgi:pilus assembly protein CpaC
LSVVIDLPRDIKDVLVSDPKIATAVVAVQPKCLHHGSRSVRLISFSSMPMVQRIGGLDIAVTRDLNGVRAALKRDLPGEDVYIEGVGEGVLLSGNVATPMEAQSGFDIASRLGRRR